MQLTNNRRIENNAVVIFDSIVYSSEDSSIIYDTSTGKVTFNEVGVSLVNWWVTTSSYTITNGASFAITINNNKQIIGNLPNRLGEVFSNAIVEVKTTPTYMSLTTVY